MKKSGERIIFWLVALILLAGAVFIIIRAVMPAENVLLPDQFSKEDWIKGNPASKTVLIEYSDFQCPACAHYHDMIDEIIFEFGAYMKFAYRHYPLKSIHKNAVLAASASEAAGKQEKFWEMHDILFARQNEWSELSNEDAKEAFLNYAHDINLNQTQFLNDLDSKEVKDAVENEYKSAVKANLTGTPTFFLNGKKIQNPQDIQVFRTLIRKVIESKDL